MTSDRGKPIQPPRYTRTTYKGRSYVALGNWTQAQMLDAIKEIERDR